LYAACSAVLYAACSAVLQAACSAVLYSGCSAVSHLFRSTVCSMFRSTISNMFRSIVCSVFCSIVCRVFCSIVRSMFSTALQDEGTNQMHGNKWSALPRRKFNGKETARQTLSDSRPTAHSLYLHCSMLCEVTNIHQCCFTNTAFAAATPNVSFRRTQQGTIGKELASTPLINKCQDNYIHLKKKRHQIPKRRCRPITMDHVKYGPRIISTQMFKESKLRQ
jgi:hypothetical protein